MFTLLLGGKGMTNLHWMTALTVIAAYLAARIVAKNFLGTTT